jgi:hypothetical protein
MAQPNFTWAANVSCEAVAALGPVRLIRGLEALAADGEVWVRGPQLEAADREAVRRVPWQVRYELLEGEHLRRAGRLLPESQLPRGAWTRLPEFLRAEMPAPTTGGSAPLSVPVELRPDSHEPQSEPGILEVRTSEWLAWVETAPGIRLERLAFALDAASPDRVLIRGTPLPPLPGLRFLEEKGVAVPAGSRWWPHVSAATLRAAFGVEKNQLILLRPEQSWVRVPRTAWIGATRSAVRLTLAEARHAG